MDPVLSDPTFDDPAIQAAYNELQPALKQLFRADTKESEMAQMAILNNMEPVPHPLPDVLDSMKTAPNIPPMMHLGYRIHDDDVRQVWHNYYADKQVDSESIDEAYDKWSEELAAILECAELDSQKEWKAQFGRKKTSMIQCRPGYPNINLWLVSVVDSWDWSGMSETVRKAVERDAERVKKLLGQEEAPKWYLDSELTWWTQPEEMTRVMQAYHQRRR
ncbi:hypothetical protein BDW22DRAFT_1360085 [Trametopsis cervina]|nr:hypothetical protein BDW22DRAFT_1360085 [Trametopsis cervina]